MPSWMDLARVQSPRLNAHIDNIGEPDGRDMVITGADEPWAEGWHEPKIGGYLHRVHYPREGRVEVFHGALGMERLVATIRRKSTPRVP